MDLEGRSKLTPRRRRRFGQCRKRILGGGLRVVVCRQRPHGCFLSLAISEERFRPASRASTQHRGHAEMLGLASDFERKIRFGRHSPGGERPCRVTQATLQNLQSAGLRTRLVYHRNFQYFKCAGVAYRATPAPRA